MASSRVIDPKLLAQLNSPLPETGKTSAPKNSTKVTDPNLLSQLNAEPSFGENVKDKAMKSHDWVMRNLSTALLDTAQGTLNAPANITEAFIGPERTRQGEQKYLPEILRRSDINFGGDKDIPLVGKQLYNPNPSGAEKIFQGAVKYSPFGLGSAKLLSAGAKAAPKLLERMAAQAAGGAAYGVTQNKNPLEGGVEGAAMGPLAELAGTAAGGAVNKGANYLGSKVIQPLSKSIQDHLKQSSDTFLTDIYHRIADRYQNHIAETGKQWDSAVKQAKNLDSQHNMWYDDQGRKEGLKPIETEWKAKYARNPSKINKAALDYIDHLKGLNETSFADAIEHGKGLNDVFGEMEFSNAPVPPRLMNQVIGNFKNHMEENFKDNKLTKEFGDTWKKANAMTKEKYDTFHETPNGDTAFAKLYHGKHPAEYSGVIKDFLPADGQEGTANFEQLSKMLGSKDLAASAIKASHFGKNASPQEIISKFGQLNEGPKSFLFNNKERKNFQALHDYVKKNPDALKTEKGKTSAMSRYIIPLLTSGAIANYVNPLAGAGIAAATLGAPLASGIAHAGANAPGLKQLLIRQLSGRPTVERELAKLLKGGATGAAQVQAPISFDDEATRKL